jgi:hypothetical protein
MYLLLACFALYAIRVCPTDLNHNSPVCYGLTRYRDLVLEPYVLPAFHRALAHPSIAPHVDRVKPHVDTATRMGKPIVRLTRVVWNSRIMPQWRKRVVPQWNKHIVPQLLRVDQKVEPYRSRVTQEYTRYSNHIAPRLSTAKITLRRWQRRTQPYIVLAATKTQSGFQAAKPYAIPICKSIKAGVQQLLLFTKKQRILFVDPHVAKIWDKVKELSSGTPKGSGAVKEEHALSTAAASVTNVDMSMTEDGTIPPPTSSAPREAETTASVTTKPSTIVTAPPMSDATESSTVVIESPPTVPATEDTVVSVSSVGPGVAKSISPASASSAAATSPSGEATPLLKITGPSLLTDGPTPTPLETTGETDIDLDQFVRELGLDDSATTGEADDLTAAFVADIPEETESEEEQAERERQKEIGAAQKRADITARHTKWETELNDLVKSKNKSLRKALVAIRKLAAVELKENKQIRAVMDDTAAEAEKYLKGAEAYLKTLKTEKKKEFVKLTIWEKLIAKVDSKFRDSLKVIDNVVNEWYMDVLDKEAHEVRCPLLKMTR